MPPVGWCSAGVGPSAVWSTAPATARQLDRARELGLSIHAQPAPAPPSPAPEMRRIERWGACIGHPRQAAGKSTSFTHFMEDKASHPALLDVEEFSVRTDNPLKHTYTCQVRASLSPKLCELPWKALGSAPAAELAQPGTKPAACREAAAPAAGLSLRRLMLNPDDRPHPRAHAGCAPRSGRPARHFCVTWDGISPTGVESNDPVVWGEIQKRLRCLTRSLDVSIRASVLHMLTSADFRLKHAARADTSPVVPPRRRGGRRTCWGSLCSRI
jgi:hypothetical protein